MNNIQGKNTFCGPAVISSISGVSTDVAERYIQQIRGNTRKVTSAYTSEVVEALSRLGYRSSYLTHLSSCGSIFYLLSVLEDGQYIVMIPGHFICIEVEGNKKFICDNHTKKPLSISSSARLSQQVQIVVKVERR